MGGLFRRVAKSAVAAGAAKKVVSHVRERQQGGGFGSHDAPGGEAPPPAPAAPQAAAPPADPIQRLKDLADLKSQGILTDDEFAAQKARILAA